MCQCHFAKRVCVCACLCVGHMLMLVYMVVHACAVMPSCVDVCVCVLAIVVHGNVPPWLYMHVFFAVGFPKERAFGTLVPRWTHPKPRYSMRSLKSQPNIKMQHTYSTTPAVKAGEIQYGQKPRCWKPHLSVCLSLFLRVAFLECPKVCFSLKRQGR